MEEYADPGGPARLKPEDTPVVRAIKERRSIRSYMDVPVEWDKIITAVEAAMVAPSAGNLQVWRYVVVRKLEKRKQIAEACLRQYWMEQAPVHVVIVAKLEKEEQFYGKRGVDLYSVQDCAMAAMNMMLAAHDLDLGSCFVSAFDENALSRVFNLSEVVRPQGVVTLGYTDQKPEPPVRFRGESVIGIENYGTAMNEGPGRVADGNAAVSNYRYVQRFQKYAQDGFTDVSKKIKQKYSQGGFGGIKEKIKEKKILDKFLRKKDGKENDNNKK